MGADRTTRFTCDRGCLEMMTPLDEHDRCHKLIEFLTLVLTGVMKLQNRTFVLQLVKRSFIG